MAALDVKAIRKAISSKEAQWTAKEHPLLKMPDQEQKQRLGVILDDHDLQTIRRRPEADMVQIVAEFKGLRADKSMEMSEAGAGADGEDAKTAALRRDYDEYLYRLDWEILDKIRDHIHIIPQHVDWRNRKGRNNVTSVKDQGGCGSCVSFGSTGTLESMILIEHNVSMDLSEAELLFCGGGSCGGWWPSSAVTYMMSNGISHEACFPYADHNMPCATCSERDGEAVKVNANVTISDVAQRKQYLSNVGPVMCVFEVYGDFFGYSSGVYSHVTGGLAGLHCVEVIGFDDRAGAHCWICKNSWGSGWGDSGFFRIAYGQCGIDSTYPFWGISGSRWYA